MSLDIFDLKDYGPEKHRGFRYVLLGIDNFWNIFWPLLLKNKIAQTITNSSEILLKLSKRKPNLIELNDASEFVIKASTNLSNNKNIKKLSRDIPLRALFAETFNRTIRDLLKKPVFQKADGNWIVVLPTITNQYKNITHSPTKLTRTQASLTE